MHGSTQRKRDIAMKTRIALVVAAMMTVAIALPARADTTIKSSDGTVELTVPNGWREGKPFGPAIKLVATSARGGIVFVRLVNKEDFRDLKSVADASIARLKKNMPDAQPKVEDIKVNDKPAIRVSIEGTQANGQRRGFLLTFFETPGHYVDVAAMARASAFKAEESVFASLASRVKVLGGSTGAAPAAPPHAAPSSGGPPPSSRAPR
jgi:hypothetical protein